MTDRTNSDDLKTLEAKIEAAKAAQSDGKRGDDHYSAAQVGWQMVTELVAGIGIGFGIGFGLDAVFGTRPFLMVIFLILGFIAGVKTMIRSAQEVQRKQIDAADAAAREREEG